MYKCWPVRLSAAQLILLIVSIVAWHWMETTINMVTPATAEDQPASSVFVSRAEANQWGRRVGEAGTAGMYWLETIIYNGVNDDLPLLYRSAVPLNSPACLQNYHLF